MNDHIKDIIVPVSAPINPDCPLCGHKQPSVEDFLEHFDAHSVQDWDTARAELISERQHRDECRAA